MDITRVVIAVVMAVLDIMAAAAVMTMNGFLYSSGIHSTLRLFQKVQRYGIEYDNSRRHCLSHVGFGLSFSCISLSISLEAIRVRVMAELDPTAAMKARWSAIQPWLFPFLREEVDPLTAKLEQLIPVLDAIGLEAYVRAEAGGRGKIGAPSSQRPS